MEVMERDTTPAAAESLAFIRIARVKEISGLSKSTIRRWIEAGKFPKPVIEDGNNVMYDLAEVLAWRASHFKKRDEREAQRKAKQAEASA